MKCLYFGCDQLLLDVTEPATGLADTGAILVRWHMSGMNCVRLPAGISHGSPAPSPVLSVASPAQYGRTGNPASAHSGRPHMSIRYAKAMV